MVKKLAVWLVLLSLIFYNCPLFISHANAFMHSFVFIEAGIPGLEGNYFRLRTTGDPHITIGPNDNFILKIGIYDGTTFNEDITLNPGDDYFVQLEGNEILLYLTEFGAGAVQDSIDNDISTHAEVSISATPINLVPNILDGPLYSSLTPINLNPPVEPEPEPEPVIDQNEEDTNNTLDAISRELDQEENLDFDKTKEKNDDLIELLESDMDLNTFMKVLPNLQNIIEKYTRTYTLTDNQSLVGLVQDLVNPFTRNLLRLNDLQLLTETEKLMMTLSAIPKHNVSNRNTLYETGKRVLDAVAQKLSTERITFTIIQNNKRNFIIDNPKAKPRADKINQSLEALDQIRSNFFDDESSYSLKRQILFTLDTPPDHMGFEARIAPEVEALLGAYRLESLVLRINGSLIELPKAVISETNETQVDLSFDYTSIPPSINQRESFSKGQLVTFDYSINGIQQTEFLTPITLKFELNRFTFSKDTSVDQLAIYRYDPGIDMWLPVGGTYDPITMTLSVKRGSLSQYTVLKSSRTFNDIENTSAKDAVQKLLNKGVIQPTTSFNPDSPLTREEFASWIAKTYGLSTSKTIVLPFTDVSRDSAHYDSIAAVYSQGLVSGKSKTIFDPKGNITKQEMAKIIGGALVLYENKKSNIALTTRILATGTDLPDWAQTGISLMVDLGFMDTSDLSATTSFMTKESAAAILGKLF